MKLKQLTILVVGLFRYILLFVLLFNVSLLNAQEKDSICIELQNGEYWWGGLVWDGHVMPISNGYTADQYGDNKGNQAQPLLLSNLGRIVWSEAPLAYSMNNGKLIVQSYGGTVSISQGGESLKEAYLQASSRYFPASNRFPDELLFSSPQYNTWIELVYNQNQKDILRYGASIVENKFPPGVLMIDDNWQEDYGNWDFHHGRFENPKMMVDSLHKMGFKVMLWICPFVSPDSEIYRKLEQKNCFVKGDDNLPKMVRWWNGVSAVLDFTNPDAVYWFNEELLRLQREYGIDGFKFDAGDSHFYDGAITSYKDSAIPNDHTFAFEQFGLSFPLNEYRATWKMGGQPLAQRLHDKGHNWQDLKKLIPQIGLQGILGYPFNCPDMIGGGEFGSFINLVSVDQELIVRSAQIHALMPMMQFSVAPWRVLDNEHLNAVKGAVEVRKLYTNTILGLMRNAAKTGEPIVRLMEYEFPNQGFENTKDQFMLGTNILVAPVLERGAKERIVLLPSGKWEYGSKIYKGGKSVRIAVGLEDIPIFLRK